MKKTLIMVGMIESSHLQKWIKATISTKSFSKIIVLPSDYPLNKINLESFRLGKKQKTKLIVFKLPVGKKLNNFTFQILDLIFGLNWRALVLFIFIKIFQPRIVHFHELQHGGYIYNSKIFKSASKRNYKVICSSWGSDLILYGKLASHKLPLKQLLSNTDVLTAERKLEVEIARKLNYSKAFLAPVYNTVGAKVVSNVLLIKPSHRKMILIKGYQDNHGRALNALAALTLITEHLVGYKIGVFSASTAVALQVDYLQNNSSLDIEIIERTSNEEIRNYLSQSRVYIGLAISDGLSTSMVEAMEQGTFPIQSENSAASSFIKNGITGYIVDPWDITGVANCIEKAVKDDQMVDTAAVENTKILEAKYNYESGLSQIKELYKC
jgi:glycosyltransferase involved in cell wall biosynthesis